MRTIKRDIVGAFIFSKDHKILLGQSGKGGVYQKQWVVPGGGIKPGETHEQAVIREIQEEVGIDVSHAEISRLPNVSSGTSEKTLRDTNETVNVEMTFYDFVFRLDLNASDIKLTLEDDLEIARWFSKEELSEVEVGSATMHVLETISF